MRVEDTINHFAEAIVLMVGTFPYVEDIFFVKKIRGKVETFVSEYIRLLKQEETVNVAQYYMIEKIILRTDEILELFELISYLKAVKKITPLLLANQSLLILKLDFTKIKKSLDVDLKKRENSAPTVTPKSSDQNQPSIANRAMSRKNIRPSQELNPNKEKILNFIKKSPNTRTKDIIHEFNALSDRTVKRNLGELLKVGLINRKIENKAAYYSAEN